MSVQIVCVQCDAVNRLPPGRDPKAGKCGKCHQPLFDGHPASLTTARLNAARSAELVRIDAVSKQDNDNAQAALRQAHAGMFMAR